MKKLIALLVAFFFAGTCFAQITGSGHDFSSESWMPGGVAGEGEICLPCHAPHDGNLTIADAPLWNHDVTSSTYTLYSSGTLTASDLSQPDGASKLCLSCHDGTVALDAFGGNTGTTYITGKANMGTNLQNDHPVSFTYDAALATADGGLFDPTTATSGLGGTISADMLFSDKLECASCHNAHDNTNGSFLVMSNIGSALCLTCHDK